MPAPVIWAICALSRPHELPRVAREFSAQTHHRYSRLLVVENGKGVGAVGAQGLADQVDVVARSAPHQAAARNAGLAVVRELCGPLDWFAVWDDDDQHGPGYLAEIAEHACGQDVLGKSSFFMRLGDRRLVCFMRPAHRLWGGTLAGRVKGVLDFRDVGRWGEDGDWLRRMREQGARVASSSRWQFIAQRSRSPDKHAWRATDRQVLQCLQHSGRGTVVRDYGVVDSDAFVHDGGLEPPWRELPHKPFDWRRDAPALTLGQ
jgi:glycosyltransferase involved in cell wall biosynthesis